MPSVSITVPLRVHVDFIPSADLWIMVAGVCLWGTQEIIHYAVRDRQPTSAEIAAWTEDAQARFFAGPADALPFYVVNKARSTSLFDADKVSLPRITA